LSARFPSGDVEGFAVAEATHEQLWEAVVPDEDYEAGRHYGETQCFSCAFYHELHGEAALDWGVCFNPDRHVEVC
jgi:hypothetical protein